MSVTNTKMSDLAKKVSEIQKDNFGEYVLIKLKFIKYLTNSISLFTIARKRA